MRLIVLKVSHVYCATTLINFMHYLITWLSFFPQRCLFTSLAYHQQFNFWSLRSILWIERVSSRPPARQSPLTQYDTLKTQEFLEAAYKIHTIKRRSQNITKRGTLPSCRLVPCCSLLICSIMRQCIIIIALCCRCLLLLWLRVDRKTHCWLLDWWCADVLTACWGWVGRGGILDAKRKSERRYYFRVLTRSDEREGLTPKSGENKKLEKEKRQAAARQKRRWKGDEAGKRWGSAACGAATHNNKRQNKKICLAGCITRYLCRR
jgi:hypothetical protein